MKQQRYMVYTILTVFVGLLAGVGCQLPTNRAFISDPSSQAVTRPGYTIELTPLKRGRTSFEVFRFTLGNRGSEDIRIDWHETLYLLNGRAYGMFVSNDTEPGRLRDPDKRYAIVRPGESYTKEIAPAKLIAYAPAKYAKNAPMDGPPFRPGPIPKGRSGIRLVMIRGDNKLSEDLSIDIMEVDAN